MRVTNRLRRLADLGAQEVSAVVAGTAVGVRTQYHMRRPLTGQLGGAEHLDGCRAASLPEDLGVILEVNGAAFHWHPEQRLWDEAGVLRETAGDTGAAAELLVHDGGGDGGVDGFVLLRPGRRRAGAVGELAVLAVHPRAAGRGAGRLLVRAGLARLGSHGCTAAELYVDAGNVRAVSLFVASGFLVRRVERLHGESALQVPAGAPPG